MYNPYFRGKQYELITIRETAGIMARANFVPIIEPVKEALGGLHKTLEAVCDVNGQAILIVNPHHGDHAEDGENISNLLRDHFLDKPRISAGILLKETMTAEDAVACCDAHAEHSITLVHGGFSDVKALADVLGPRIQDMRHVFFEAHCGRLYRRYFAETHRILLRDGFVRRRNRDHPELELFSDLHITYPDEGMNGFGDFLVVGDDFAEGGGPAYAVAIHLTFIDPTKDNAMYIYHFVSERQDTPTDPAGKFAEALEVMIRKLEEPDSHVFETSAIQEFRTLHRRGHFPGLGYIKKLSMKHHIETLAQFL